MRRVILIILDSFGIGGAADAADFGDEGANTLATIARDCLARNSILAVPHMMALGLGQAAQAVTGHMPAGLPAREPVTGLWGAAREISRGKDTPSGHWEIAGLPVPFDWGYFPKTRPAFSPALTDAIIAAGNLAGILGNCHASGTEIIAQLGEEHIRSGKPVIYTSADSVIQIAAHETYFGLQRLYDLCTKIRILVDPLNIGRVIARPFIGENAANFERTGNRRDYAVPPPRPTLLNVVEAAGRKTYAVGKISDIFAGSGITHALKAHGNEALVDATLAAMDKAQDGDLIFTNLVDFDSLYGHRRDSAGYGAALEAFDRRLPELRAKMQQGDLLILTADHGCDPAWPGSDHTRECVPVLIAGAGAGTIGIRDSFADIGKSVAAYLGYENALAGQSFLGGGHHA
ncbi:phosphopentomutase [Pseudochrobactrum sp. HB0163]|uniref:phosphopentomutase n=1 Tax=Pseudochrobactrum sp. HB0163 TaxID=3450708 RepID=UPI003F6DFE17